jgi:two-component system nitrogen regulation sensor histidine kinase NtrY
MCSVLLVLAAGFATPAQRDIWRIRHDWDTWRVNTSVAGLGALKQSLDDAVASAVTGATQAAKAPGDRAAAFDALNRLVHHGSESGVVVYRGDSALAWAGVIRTPLDLIHEGPVVVTTPFYLSLQVMRRSGDAKGVSVLLLDAAPPADKLASPLARAVANDVSLGGFSFWPVNDSVSSAEILHYSNGGIKLFDVTAKPLLQGEVVQRILERVRARAGIAFILALGFFVIGVWRATRTLAQRVGALAVGMACTALVPLNQYSNLTRLFDPSTYFTPRGGALTGNAGALATTSAIVLLGILAVFRRQKQRASRWGAAAAILLVAGLGPFLLRELARGVQVPSHGVDGALWLIWEIPLFLAAVSVLLTGAAAGAIVLGSQRGLSPWVAPWIATVAAVLAPAVWDAPGRFPWWYAILWIVAVVLLALSRRTRYVILSAATVAALGATTLVWARTARGRVDAAIHDLQGLSQVDPVASTLMRRFGATLGTEYGARTRQALLATYVSSDISAAGNPIALSAWPSDSAPDAHFETSAIPIPAADVRRRRERWSWSRCRRRSQSSWSWLRHPWTGK